MLVAAPELKLRCRRDGCWSRKTKLRAQAARLASRGGRGARRHTGIGHAGEILPSCARPDWV